MHERREVLRQLEDWLETPMLVLGLVWFVLLVIELAWDLSPLFETLGTVIWVIFVLDFVVKFLLAPDKLDYLKGNWLTVIALALPALRVLRIARGAVAARRARLGGCGWCASSPRSIAG